MKARATWDPNQEPDLAGYKIYIGEESGNYSRIIDVGNVNLFEIDNLDTNKLYYICITAYDQAGNESEFSQELKYSTMLGDMNNDGEITGSDYVLWMRKWQKDDLKPKQQGDITQDGIISGSDVIKLRLKILK